ncbi:MAG: hypothetical protein JST16_01910 [Bdellovibrionales bacterium]|nr:hypothetical protein [Bdellovibrionales bacterium]
MRLPALLFLFALGVRADLAAVRAEPNLEKRSEKAIENADTALDAARKAYQSNDAANLKTSLDEVGQSILLTKQSLDQSGKNARRNPKYFKKAEVSLRKLGRRLDSFRLELSVDERAPVDKLIDDARQAQEHILQLIMGKK